MMWRKSAHEYGKRLIRGIILFVKSYIVEKPRGLDFSLRQKSRNIITDGNHGYALTQKKAFDAIMQKISVDKDDCFIDIGCGKGATLYYATHYGFRRIAGIEVESSLYEIAKNNFKKLNLPGVELFLENAVTFDKYGQFNIFFLFNPFDDDIYIKVLENIVDSLNQSVEHKKAYLICYGASPVEYIRQSGKWELTADYLDKVRVTAVHIWKFNNNEPKNKKKTMSP